MEQIEKAIIQAITQKAWTLNQTEHLTKSDVLLKLEEKYQKLLAIGDLDSDPHLRNAQIDLQYQIEQASMQEDSVAKKMLRHPQAQKINFWYTLTAEERRIVYEKLVSRVEIEAKQVTAVVLKV